MKHWGQQKSGRPHEIWEEGKQYLKALNPDWPNRIIEVDEEATICGVIVFKGEVV